MIDISSFNLPRSTPVSTATCAENEVSFSTFSLRFYIKGHRQATLSGRRGGDFQQQPPRPAVNLKFVSFSAEEACLKTA